MARACRKTGIFLLILATFGASGLRSVGQDKPPDVGALLARLDDLYRSKSSIARRRLPVHLTLTPTDTEGQRTELRYLDVQFNAPIADDTFSLSRLERTR
jgi:hypothetical protein